MRVAYVSPYFPIKEQPHRGQSAFQTLLRMQGRNGVEIEAFCPLSVYPRWAQPKNYPYTRADLTWQPPGGIPAHYIEYPALPVVGRAWTGLACARAIRRKVQAFRPDVILNYWLYPEGYASVRVGRALGVPVITGAIGSDLNRIPDRVTGWWTKKAVTGADYIVTVSEHLRQRAIAMGAAPERSRRIINGADLAVFHPASRDEARRRLGIDAHDRIVLFVGWISPTKGLGELADAFTQHQLAARHERLRCVLIGEGPMRGELEARIAGAGLAPERWLFAGRKTSAEIADWLAAADLFCLPSWAEGCPNVVVEALACGRPVVASRVGGIPELVDTEAKGLLVEPRDAAALGRALDAALTREWDEAAIGRASARDWADCARETEAVCREVIARRGRAE